MVFLFMGSPMGQMAVHIHVGDWGQGVCRGRGDCGSDFPSQGSDLLFSPLPAHPPAMEFRAVLP